MSTLRVLETGAAFGAPYFRDRDSIWAARADPVEVIDCKLDWTGWLVTDTILTRNWTAENATVDRSSNKTNGVTVWVTTPADPNGSVTNAIVTTAGRTPKFKLQF